MAKRRIVTRRQIADELDCVQALQLGFIKDKDLYQGCRSYFDEVKKCPNRELNYGPKFQCRCKSFYGITINDHEKSSSQHGKRKFATCQSSSTPDNDKKKWINKKEDSVVRKAATITEKQEDEIALLTNKVAHLEISNNELTREVTQLSSTVDYLEQDIIEKDEEQHPQCAN